MTVSVLVVDGANVLGAKPNGWWKDRAGATARMHSALMQADLPHEHVVLVLEGKAKLGVLSGRDGHVETVHASRDGDSAIVRVAREHLENFAAVTVVTADRALQGKVESLGARTMSPTWLWSYLDN